MPRCTTSLPIGWLIWDADRAVGMGDDTIEVGKVDRAGVDIEAACALAESFDRRIDFQFLQDAEMDETDAAGAERSDLRLRRPAVDDTPVIEHHVVDAVGRHWTTVAHSVDVRAIDRESTAGDLVWCAGRASAVAVDRIGFEPPHG